MQAKGTGNKCDTFEDSKKANISGLRCSDACGMNMDLMMYSKILQRNHYQPRRRSSWWAVVVSIFNKAFTDEISQHNTTTALMEKKTDTFAIKQLQKVWILQHTVIIYQTPWNLSIWEWMILIYWKDLLKEKLKSQMSHIMVLWSHAANGYNLEY